MCVFEKRIPSSLESIYLNQKCTRKQCVLFPRFPSSYWTDHIYCMCKLRHFHSSIHRRIGARIRYSLDNVCRRSLHTLWRFSAYFSNRYDRESSLLNEVLHVADRRWNSQYLGTSPTDLALQVNCHEMSLQIQCGTSCHRFVFFQTAARLAQLDKRRSAEREVPG